MSSNEFSGTIPEFTQNPSLLEAYNSTNNTTFNLRVSLASNSEMDAILETLCRWVFHVL